MHVLQPYSRLITLFAALCFSQAQAQVDYTQYVNPFIGTGGHGHTFPGAAVPFGMVQLSPDTRIDGSWDGCSGYHYSDDFIYGFSHTHLSGTGCSDYGDIAILPFDRIENKKTKEQPAAFDYGTFCERFDHKKENAEAGYYKVQFENDIVAELTSTTRCGMHRYTFPKGEGADVVLKLTHRDKTIQSRLTRKSSTVYEGFRRSSAWAKDQHIYFVIEFSSPATEIAGLSFNNSHTDESGNHYTVFTFKKLKGKPLLIRVGISTVSIEGARKNLKTEIPGWNFEEIKTKAKAEWNRELSKIEVTSTDKNKLATFYTALYHCMIHPSVASDVDGNYRGRDNKIHKAEGFTYYTVFSLWDTFRGLHPLLTIIDQKRTSDFIKTFLAQYKEGGRLPVWELSSNETDCMIGYHSISVIADAYAKGIRNFDADLALEAMQKSATWNHLGLPQYIENGFLQIEDEHESVSKTLEYAYDDWCIASMAQSMAKADVYTEYIKRAKNWMNLFDPQTGFMRPRSNGGWLTPFEPREVNNNFTEANAWQYTFFVPHDIGSMMKLMGREGKFAAKLDELFNADNKTVGRDQADITGLIGQYAHGNEPSHHMAYLYVYAKQPWKAQRCIHKIQTEFYKNAPDGLIGNEDCGQMSAWHVLSSLGFYPVCPGNADYTLGTPSFEKSIIHLENGKTFTLTAQNLNDTNFYIRETDKFYITHDEIANGGEKTITMSNEPITEVLTRAYMAFPYTGINYRYSPAPIIVSDSKTFRDSMCIEIIAPMKDVVMYDVLNQEQNSTTPHVSHWYTRPFQIHESCTVRSFYDAETFPQSVARSATASFHKIPHNWTVQLNSKYNRQYTAGGDAGIIDGLHGDENWRKGGWQGYQAQDFECIIDLQKIKDVSTVEARFLQDQRAWIFMPKKVEYYYSEDGKNWMLLQTVDNNDVKDTDEKVQVKTFAASSNGSHPARYVKVKAINYGKLPKWHPGFGMNGDDAFIFIDEIEIK